MAETEASSTKDTKSNDEKKSERTVVPPVNINK